MRDVAQLLAAAVLVLGLGWFVYGWQFRPEPPGSLSVKEVQGDVQVNHPSGAITPGIGTELLGDERLVTGATGSKIVLSLGERSHITVEAESRVRVVGSTDEGVQLELEDGRVRATVRPGDGELGLLAREREILARDAAFVVGLGKDGTTEVQVGSGEVLLEGFDQVEKASGGQRVVASEHGARLAPIPTSLLLKVAWPEERTRQDRVAVAGTTDPGARVVVTGTGESRAVTADGEGRFEAHVVLKEGTNVVEVAATSVLGLETRASWKITRDSQGPTGVFEVRY